jgi:hydrogenase-4 membrane subunit HyfE
VILKIITLPFYILYGFFLQQKSPHDNRGPLVLAMVTAFLISASIFMGIEIKYNIEYGRGELVIIMAFLNGTLFIINRKNIENQAYNFSKLTTNMFRLIVFSILLLPWLVAVYKGIFFKPI